MGTQASPVLDRLDAFGESLAQREGTRALIGLGTVGRKTARVDAWSDLDCFIIVRPGHKSTARRSLQQGKTA